ncbi:MAG TPA: glucuronate isomerase [Planctomycetota bacterium]|nr:glucuronate isomerase [Planctomycetota bacterium]HRR79803.1 glucuronate isomerase [Planctomycetota bacterium]HRT94176.1 glucuronate isomerase [Planctomycetota bacterium]
MADALITENFMLESQAAVRLFHEHARDLPIIDYHCHLPPAQVAEDHRFRSMTEIWLGGDHYKWRLLRTAGVPERLITGDASDWEKFAAWAATMPKLLRNPIYHWSHMELKRPFGISDRLLNADTAQGIWDECNALLAQPTFSARGIMRQMNVALVCTTDDPADSLEHHQKVAADASFPIQMLPAWRPDRAMAVDNPAVFRPWVEKLAAAANVHIKDIATFREALRKRHEFFHANGCRLSDHGIETFYAEPYAEFDLRGIFLRARAGAALEPAEVAQFKSAMLYEFAVMDFERGWTQQFHLCALRNNNRRLFQALGPDVGGDSIGEWPVAQPMSRFLGRLDEEGKLARTIVYSLNPTHNAVLATMIGNFQDGSVPGKLQVGSAWWFNDQADGMLEHLEAISNMSLLSPFVGMLTDSRSFLSYTRHEYFRRLLCNLLGGEIERGLLPRDFGLVGGLVRDVCFGNASRYFGFAGLPKV